MSIEQKKILVTGGAGFIGSNFIHYVLEKRKNYSIINLDALTYAGNLNNFNFLSEEKKKRHKFIKGNICDKETLENIFKQDKIDGVINFAAESHVDRSISTPINFIQTNIFGTFNLLEVIKKSNTRLVHISTDEVYGSLGKEGYFKETTPYDPSSPYSASKASSDHLVKAYHRTYNTPCIITNCSNNYGPFQFPEKLIPLIILNCLENKTLPVYGDGKNIRDWLYVLDHCEAILTVFEKGIVGENYNIGGNSELQNIEIINILCDIVDKKLNKKVSSKKLIKFIADRPGHDRRYAIDFTKIKNELAWSPKYKFSDAIEKTVSWYLDNIEWVKSVQTGEYKKWIEKNYSKNRTPF